MTTSRNLPAGVEGALDQGHVVMFLLVELYFDGGTVYLSGLGHDVNHGGNTYVATQSIGSVAPTTESGSGVRGLTFTLSASGSAAIASALTEPVQDRKVVVKLGVLDASGDLLIDPNVWTGYLDVMTITDSARQPTIKVTAEHAMARWQQPSGKLFSHADHIIDYPNDKFFEFADEMASKSIIWPSKEALL